jgi:hypothetical protein
VLGLCGVLALAPRASWASPESFETLLERGAAQAEGGEIEAAADTLAAAYRAMPGEHRVGDFGRFVMNEASAACLEAANRSSAPRLRLEQCEALLTEYFRDLDGARARAESTADEDATEAALAGKLDLVRARIAEAGQEARPPEPPPPAIEPAVAPSPEVDRPARGVDPVGVAAVSAGAVFFGAGLGLLVHGVRFPGLLDRARADARQQHGIDESEEPPSWEAHADAQLPKGRAMLGVGVAMAVVGAAATTWGVVRLTRQRKGSTRVHAAMGRSEGLLVVEGHLPALGMRRQARVP